MGLRDYQIEAISKILNSFEDNDSVLFQMPTGTGKTTVFAEIVRRWIKEIVPNKRLLILVHRKELVDQIIRRLMQFGVLAARIQAGYEANLNLRVQVGMVQSLKNPKRLPINLSLIVIDEAHHVPAMSYRKILGNYGDKIKILGVTATPCRLNGDGFGDLFSKLICSDSISSFIQNGHLAPIKHLATSLPDLSKLKYNQLIQDYDEKEVEALVRNDKIMADLVDSYIKYANGKKCLIFALNKAHSKDIVKRFKSEGINSIFIDADTSKIERDRIVEEFKIGKYQVLCNVNIFTEGFDCPDIEVVQLARPTKSLVLYLQQVGRVMRSVAGKEYGLILDNACLWKEHGLVTQNFKWSLEEGVRKDINKKVVPKGHLSNPTSNNELPEEMIGLELIEVDSSEIKIQSEIVENTNVNIGNDIFNVSKVLKGRELLNYKRTPKYLYEMSLRSDDSEEIYSLTSLIKHARSYGYDYDNICLYLIELNKIFRTDIENEHIKLELILSMSDEFFLPNKDSNQINSVDRTKFSFAFLKACLMRKVLFESKKSEFETDLHHLLTTKRIITEYINNPKTSSIWIKNEMKIHEISDYKIKELTGFSLIDQNLKYDDLLLIIEKKYNEIDSKIRNEVFEEFPLNISIKN